MSSDGKHAVSAGLDGLVKLWDAHAGTAISKPIALLSAPIRGVAFSPDGSRIAAVGADKLAWLFGTDGRDKLKLEGHQGTVMTAAFSQDGQQIATGSWDKTVMVWDARSGSILSKPMRHGGPFWYAVAFSGDGKSIVAGCDDHTVRIWDIETAKPIGPKLPHEAALRGAAFAENDSQIITGTSAGTTRIWNVSRSPMKGSVDQIELWLQVSTGMELDGNGEIRPLDPKKWQARRKLLDERGGPPEA